MRALLLATLLLAGCQKSPWVDLPPVERTVRLTEIDPPKYFSIKLLDIEGNVEYGPIYISKRCYGYERIPLNSEFKVSMKVWENSATGEIAVEPNIDELYQKFCS